MTRVLVISIFVLATIAACTTAGPSPQSGTIVTSGRPLQVLPPQVDLGQVRSDLVVTARERFGEAALARALAAPTHLIAKRFMGMVPPPPPGAGPDWVAPTPAALLMKGANGWMMATESGWRAPGADQLAVIDQVIADPGFWSEDSVNLPCPDYGASLLLLKVPGKAETVRKSLCSSKAETVVSAALRA